MRVIAPLGVIFMIWFWLPSVTKKLPSRTVIAYGLPPVSMSFCVPLVMSPTGLAMLNAPMSATSVTVPFAFTL